MRKWLLAGASLIAINPAVAQTTCANGVPNFAPSVGGFGVLDGKIYTPGGDPFTAAGINVGPTDMASATPQALKQMFPGINFVRFATTMNWPGVSVAQEEAYVNSLTAAGIVVEIEDHPYPSPGVYTGATLDQEDAWYAQIAGDEKSNPYVWFGTMNEPNTGTYGPSEAAISTQEVATYNAIRGAGNNNPIMMELDGGGNPGSIGAGAGMTASSYANMTNIVWDLHTYGWSANYSTDQATVSKALQTAIQQAQTIKSADGTVPVIDGEFGDSTSGASIDPNGNQVVQAVQQAAESGLTSGAAAWEWGTGGPGDGLTTSNSGGSLSSLGQLIAAGIKTMTGGVTGCAQSPIPAAVSAAVSSLSGAASTSAGTAGAAASSSSTGGTASASPSTSALAKTADNTAATALSAAGLTIDQVAALAGQGSTATPSSIASTTQAATASGAANGDTLPTSDATADAVLAQGPAEAVATPVLATAAPIGAMPKLTPVSGSTSFSASGNFQTVVPGAGNDTGTVSGSGNTITATGGIQTISVSGPGNTITAGPYDDTITLNSAGNTINGGGGNDTVILAYGGGTGVATNADAAAVSPLASSGNVFIAPAPGTGIMTIRGTMAANDRIDMTQALAGVAGWTHNPADVWGYVTASATPGGCTISVNGQVVVSIPGGSPGGQLGGFVTAQ